VVAPVVVVFNHHHHPQSNQCQSTVQTRVIMVQDKGGVVLVSQTVSEPLIQLILLIYLSGFWRDQAFAWLLKLYLFSIIIHQLNQCQSTVQTRGVVV
jgi:hypothetical protein